MKYGVLVAIIFVLSISIYESKKIKNKFFNIFLL